MGAQEHPPIEHKTHETFSVSVPDLEYWREQIKCQYACPVGTDARGYVRAIAQGDFEQAYLIARGPNPLASICGRVCGAPCEEECRRAELDQPIAIRALKRYVCEKFGPGSHHQPRDLARFLKEIAQKYADPRLEGREELLPLLQSLLNADVPPADGQSVGVIGSGPAGLAAAHDLALLGFDVTIYEAEPILGGMLVLGIPEYRLPRDLIRSEIQVIEQLGVKFVTSCEVGKHVSLPELREVHEAVIIAVGAKRSRSLDVPGSDAEGVLGGVEFLRDVALGNPPSLGKRVVVIAEGDESPPTAGEPVVVIGGGNTAIDAARTALRLGGGPVTILYRRTREEMPAIREEIEEAIREGVEVRFLVAPTVLEGDQRVRAVRCAEMELGEPDESGRRRPIPKPDSEVVVEAEHVIVAIGQQVDLGFVDPERDGLELTDSGFIACDPDTGRTSAADVFVAGDLATGPQLLIHAIASGKAAARTVYESLTGRAIHHRYLELHLGIPDYERETDYEIRPRVTLPTTPPSERIRSQSMPVEHSLSQSVAQCEAGRCFDCGINTIFDGQTCILCGGCVDVCPQLCLRIVSVDRLNADGQVGDVLRRQLGETAAEAASAILKDETICIRCGACAERCPTGAITMEKFVFKGTPTCQPV